MSKSALDGFSNQPHIPFPSYSVIVNYDQTVEQLIKAGKYGWFEDYITSGRFPSSEKGQAEVLFYLVNFDRDISSEDAIKELDCLGLRPATLKELLAIGVAHPDLQCKNHIAGLGSAWWSVGDLVLVPYLSSNKPRHKRYLSWWCGDWYSRWKFAAVAKSDELAKK